MGVEDGAVRFERGYTKTDPLIGVTDWIELELVEKRETPPGLIELGIPLHLVATMLANTTPVFGLERRTTRFANHLHNATTQAVETGLFAYCALRNRRSEQWR